MLQQGKISIGNSVWFASCGFYGLAMQITDHKPQKVSIVHKDAINDIVPNRPATTRFDDLSFYLVPHSKRGGLLKKIASSGYLTEPKVFLTEKECREYYVKACEKILKQIRKTKNVYNQEPDVFEEQLRSLHEHFITSIELCAYRKP